MRATIRVKLGMPALLAATTVSGAMACGDDGKPSSTQTDTSAGSGSTTVPTTSTTDTDGSATMETGEPSVCAGLPDKTACVAEASCVWATEFGACIVDCAKFTDKASCATQDYCAWLGDTCELVTI